MLESRATTVGPFTPAPAGEKASLRCTLIGVGILGRYRGLGRELHLCAQSDLIKVALIKLKPFTIDPFSRELVVESTFGNMAVSKPNAEGNRVDERKVHPKSSHTR